MIQQHHKKYEGLKDRQKKKKKKKKKGEVLEVFWIRQTKEDKQYVPEKNTIFDYETR